MTFSSTKYPNLLQAKLLLTESEFLYNIHQDGLNPIGRDSVAVSVFFCDGMYYGYFPNVTSPLQPLKISQPQEIFQNTGYAGMLTIATGQRASCAGRQCTTNRTRDNVPKSELYFHTDVNNALLV